MKLTELQKHLRRHGCRLVREGRAHSIWENPVNDVQTSVPRHREVSRFMAARICKQLDIPVPGL
ncbi:MAG TPA: type II toxin-antitoxin system HicA family toxin [Pirellulales bacterium]|nr:type II toxin-antitoxin system HicA family toxin [Pirellulales bacterium]